MGFQRATRKRVFLKMAITGASGSGKTYSALRLASGISDKIALIDTENASASLYADKFNFDTLDIAPPFDFQKFVDGIGLAVKEGYEVIVIDSASHFWEGILEYKSKLDKRGGNSYTNWNDAGDKFKDILSAVLQSPVHIIACMRSKIDYVLEDNGKGKSAPRKVGLAPIMRDGIEYEFTTVFDVDMSHNAAASKDRTGLFDNKIEMITEETGKRLIDWRNSATVEEKNQNKQEPKSEKDTLLREITHIYKSGEEGKNAVAQAANESGVEISTMREQSLEVLRAIKESAYKIETGM